VRGEAMVERHQVKDEEAIPLRLAPHA